MLRSDWNSTIERAVTQINSHLSRGGGRRYLLRRLPAASMPSFDAPCHFVEVTYLTWTEDNLLRQASYQAQREDKPARQVVRPIPYPPRR
jgi:hypothetical protein